MESWSTGEHCRFGVVTPPPQLWVLLRLSGLDARLENRELGDLILAPIFLPAAIKLGIDPIHPGIIFTVNMEGGG